jgi:tetratricopeptide (TPR) repeat protein
LYDSEGGERLNYPVPNDAGLAALAILPTVEWLLGDPESAEEAIRAGQELVERLDQDFNRAYLHAWIAGTRLTQRRYRESVEHARTALEISNKNAFEEWYVTALLVGLLAEASLQASPDKLSQALETLTALAAKGVGLNASWYLWALAQGYNVAGATPVARQLIVQAFQSSSFSRPSWRPTAPRRSNC